MQKPKFFKLLFCLIFLFLGNLGAFSYEQNERASILSQISDKKLEISKDPSNHEAYLEIATLYWKLGSSGKPIKYYLVAIKLKPDYALAYYGLGNVFYTQGETEQAFHSYRRATEIDPEFAQAFNGLGNVSIDQKKYLKAIEYYKKALVLKQNYQEASYNLCSAYLYSAQYSKGADFCEKVVQKFPEAKTYNNLGNVYFRLGNFGRAKTAYQVALKIDSNLSDAHYNLAAINLVHDKNKEKALERKELLQKLNPRQGYELGKLIEISGL